MLCASLLMFDVSPVQAAQKPTITLSPIGVSAITTIRISFAKYSGVSISESSLDSNLVSASSLMQAGPSPCPVQFVRHGPLVTYGTTPIVNNSADFYTLGQINQTMKISFQILWCAKPQTTTAEGCTSTEQGFTVLASSAPFTPFTIAHEYGHIVRLENIPEEDYSNIQNLMFEQDKWPYFQNRLTQDQCNHFVRGR
jgi:hypothetical protein